MQVHIQKYFFDLNKNENTSSMGCFIFWKSLSLSGCRRFNEAGLPNLKHINLAMIGVLL
ncbi:MAG: hypothetical protein ACYTXT_29070 [Nostoc sp.]